MNTDGQNQTTIFLVEEDDDTRRMLKRNLQNEGYKIIVATDEEDALERVGEGHVDADLILVNLVGKPVAEALSAGQRIREQAKYDGHTPLVVMAEKYGEELEGRDVHVGGNAWVTYPEDHDQLKNLLARLVSHAAN